MKYQVSRVLAGPLLHLLWRPEVEGGEHIPRTGGAIIASNHLSIVDSVFLPLVLDRPLTFAAKSEYFTGTRPAQRFAGAYLRATKQLRVDRAEARAAQDMLDAALGLLRGGELFGIYPEGTRSPDGRLYRGRTGVGWLALNSGLPVIPVAMIGTDRVLPPGHTVPRLHRIRIRIGAPLTFAEHDGQGTGARARRAVADEVMQAIQALSGQEFVPMYASVRKEQLNGGRRGSRGARASGALASGPARQPRPAPSYPGHSVPRVPGLGGGLRPDSPDGGSLGKASYLGGVPHVDGPAAVIVIVLIVGWLAAAALRGRQRHAAGRPAAQFHLVRDHALRSRAVCSWPIQVRTDGVPPVAVPLWPMPRRSRPPGLHAAGRGDPAGPGRPWAELAGGVAAHGSSPSGSCAGSHGGRPDIRGGRTTLGLGVGGRTRAGTLAGAPRAPLPGGAGGNGAALETWSPGNGAGATRSPGNGAGAARSPGKESAPGRRGMVPSHRVAGERCRCHRVAGERCRCRLVAGERGRERRRGTVPGPLGPGERRPPAGAPGNGRGAGPGDGVPRTGSR